MTITRNTHELNNLATLLCKFLPAILSAELLTAKQYLHPIVEHSLLKRYPHHGKLLALRCKTGVLLLTEQLEIEEEAPPSNLEKLSFHQIDNLIHIYTVFTALVKDVLRVEDMDQVMDYMDSHFKELITILDIGEANHTDS